MENDIRTNSEQHESLEVFGRNRQANKPSVHRLTTCSIVIFVK